MKNRKKLLILFVFILICILIFCMVQIYAKYLTSASGNTKINIARWNILVNNLSIKNNTDISSSIVPVFPGNDNIASNIIAPTAEGYFDLAFDFTNADVSFSYEITTSVDSSSPVKDLVATGYSIDGGEKITFSDTSNTKISDTILLSSDVKTKNFRIYILWNDDEATSQMSNEQDTQATSSTTPALFHVNISFTQIAD